MQAVTNTTPRVLLASRTVPIDEVYNIINSDMNQHKIHAVADGGDLVSLRALLIQMFKEADDDGNGYLTYDEFEILMEKVELGIKSADLRYVIQEADENENGVVEFEEFVPLAVDSPSFGISTGEVTISRKPCMRRKYAPTWSR